MLLVGFGQGVAGAFWTFLSAGGCWGYYLLSARPTQAMTVLIGTIPVLMLLRGLVLYNSIQVLFACCLVSALAKPVQRSRLRRNTPLVCFVVASLLYWLVTVILTGDYAGNSRVVEFALGAAAVFLLSGYRSYFATAMTGVIVSTLAVTTVLLQGTQGSRFGGVSVDGDLLGNPILVGLASSLGFLLTVADRGRWLLLDRHPWVRLTLNLAMGAALVLSTSRGGWLVTLIGVVFILIFNPSGRPTLAACAVALALLIAILLQSDRGAVIQHYYDNAMNDDRTLDQRTTGRADQWKSFPQVFDDSPIWGFGPGSGKAVSLRYTREGKPWHSLYLLIGAETGLLGLSALGTLLAVLIYKAFLHLRRCGEVVPLMSAMCLMFIGVSVSGTDAMSAIFLGLAFSGRDFSAMRFVRSVSTMPLAAPAERAQSA
jgi:O-antigen ligase